MFFFQAEDGIRDDLVTGVQTCALPILRLRLAHIEQKSFFAGRQVPCGLGKLAGNVADQLQLGVFLECRVLRFLRGVRLRGLLLPCKVVRQHADFIPMRERPARRRRRAQAFRSRNVRTGEQQQTQTDNEQLRHTRTPDHPVGRQPIFYDAESPLNSSPLRGKTLRLQETFTCTPERSSFMGRTSPPASTTAASTRSRVSGSISSTTQPPPPAPQTLPASAPFRRVSATILSMVFVVIGGMLSLRKLHSSPIKRPTSAQLARSSAPRSSCATSEMRAKLRNTALSPLMCARKTSQLLIADLRGLPV